MSAILHFSLLLTVGIFGSMFARILIVTFSKRFIHLYVASQRNGGYFCTAIKHKTLPLFCFRDH
jgi:hypothetical protein